jgi:hypothetical protein
MRVQLISFPSDYELATITRAAFTPYLTRFKLVIARSGVEDFGGRRRLACALQND